MLDTERAAWKDQVALVTGAAGSIGAAIADHLNELGARVAGADIAVEAPLESDRRSLHRVDVCDPVAIEEWLDLVSHRWGSPTSAVVSTGITRMGRLVDITDADWREVIDVNLTGAFYVARAVIRRMMKDRISGHIVFIGSWAAHAPHPHIGAYSASKAGLRALCQTLALDHAQDGILINEVAPGIVDAGLSRALFRKDPELAERTRSAIPSARLIQPEDVARQVALLASPANRDTTGAVWTIDGGISLASTMNPGRRPV